MNTMEVKILAKKLKKTINHLKSDGNTHQNTSAFFIANMLDFPYLQSIRVTSVLLLHYH
jgi:hypothetical protein